MFSCLAVSTESTIGTHNLIILGDYAGSDGHVYGSAIIGGNVSGISNGSGGYTNNLEIGSRLTSANGYDGDVDAVIVLGDINASQIRTLNGSSIVYGGALNANVDSHIPRRTASASDIAYANSVLNQVYTDSVVLKNLQTNGNFSNSNFSYTGSEQLAVFNVSAQDLSLPNQELRLNKGLADTVVINVSGKNVTFTGNNVGNSGFDLASAPNIVWNFYEAETVDFMNYSPKGSIIAPYAVVSGGDFDGAVAAKSYTGNRQFHFYLFDGSGDITPSSNPNSTPVVSAPSNTAFILLIPILVLLNRLNKRQSCHLACA
jgi:choice-of-anchor A domain-containing protein